MHLEVRRAEVVPPLRDAVGFVDHHRAQEVARAQRAERRLQRRRLQPLGSHVQQPRVGLVRLEIAQEGRLALLVHSARPELSAHIAVGQVDELVLGQREQRRQHDGHA